MRQMPAQKLQARPASLRPGKSCGWLMLAWATAKALLLPHILWAGPINSVAALTQPSPAQHTHRRSGARVRSREGGCSTGRKRGRAGRGGPARSSCGRVAPPVIRPAPRPAHQPQQRRERLRDSSSGVRPNEHMSIAPVADAPGGPFRGQGLGMSDAVDHWCMGQQHHHHNHNPSQCQPPQPHILTMVAAAGQQQQEPTEAAGTL